MTHHVLEQQHLSLCEARAEHLVRRQGRAVAEELAQEPQDALDEARVAAPEQLEARRSDGAGHMAGEAEQHVVEHGQRRAGLAA